VLGRTLPYVAALVGLVALGAALFVEVQGQARSQRIAGELSEIHTSMAEFQTALALLTQQAAKGSFGAGDGAADALLALQERIATLEETVGGAASTAALAVTPATDAATAEAAPAGGPTEDCIPVGTRFMALPGDAYAICQTPEVVTLTNISAGGVVLDTGAAVVAGGVSALRFGKCTLTVISADAAGFAELKVTCT
jgi:hypothetical protein